MKELAASGELQALLPSASNVSMDDQLKALVRRDKVMLFMKGSPQAPRCGFSQTIVNILSQTGSVLPWLPVSACMIDMTKRLGLRGFPQ